MRWVVITLLCANALARKLPNPSPSLIQIEAIRSATTLPPFVFETPPSGTATVPRGGALPSDLLVRTASAIGLCVSLPLYCRSFKEPGLAALIAVVQLVGTWEVSRLPHLPGPLSPRVSRPFASNVMLKLSMSFAYAAVFSVTLFPAVAGRWQPSASSWAPLSSYGSFVGSMASLVLSLNSDRELTPSKIRSSIGQVSSVLMGSLLILPPTTMALSLVLDRGWLPLLYAAFLTAANDTFAYLGGVTFGRTSLLPVLSPKKTVEGFGTALLATVGLGYYLRSHFDLPTSLSYSVGVPLLASLVGPFGGFLASAVKRAYGVKDYGSFIPGHGGVVDRCDVLMVVVAGVYLAGEMGW